MGWRSAQWDFVNFTGTAGVWRADAIEAAGGWRAASLVEDCELSFRVLFCGYRTAFAPVPVPAELPTSVTAYKAQQKRWTLGWAQLIRLHLGTLLLSYHCSIPKRCHLLYHMLLSIQVGCNIAATRAPIARAPLDRVCPLLPSQTQPPHVALTLLLFPAPPKRKCAR